VQAGLSSREMSSESPEASLSWTIRQRPKPLGSRRSTATPTSTFLPFARPPVSTGSSVLALERVDDRQRDLDPLARRGGKVDPVEELAPLCAQKPLRHAGDAVVEERRLNACEPGRALVDQRLSQAGAGAPLAYVRRRHPGLGQPSLAEQRAPAVAISRELSRAERRRPLFIPSSRVEAAGFHHIRLTTAVDEGEHYEPRVSARPLA